MSIRQSSPVSVLLLLLMLLCSCAYRLTMHSREGDRLDGLWTFGQEGDSALEVFAENGEVLIGPLEPVARHVFLEGYKKAFGSDSIAAEGPDLSTYGNGLWSPLGSSNALLDKAYGENFNPAARQSRTVISGPLLYWTAILQGDRRTHMWCFLIGSAHSARGFGRCKNSGGKEYTVEF